MTQEALICVGMLADNNYTTVFLPNNRGVAIYKANGIEIKSHKPAVLQGWRDKRGLWMVLMKEEVSPSIDVAQVTNSVYELPSTKEVVRFLHAALGFPTKATLLTAARNGNLLTFSGLTSENISKHFPESDETQIGHMKQEKQRVRSTKVIDEDAMISHKPTPGEKHKDMCL